MHRGETPEEIAKRDGRFDREVAMLSRVQHKNLVKVVFCCPFVIVNFVFNFMHCNDNGVIGYALLAPPFLYTVHWSL